MRVTENQYNARFPNLWFQNRYNKNTRVYYNEDDDSLEVIP